MKKTKIIICILILCFLTACAEKNETSNSTTESNENKENFHIVEEMTHKVGGLYENALLDWTPRFDTVYTWGDDVKLPIEKPDGVELEIRDNCLYITKSDDEKFEEYIGELKANDFTLIEYTMEDEMNGLHTDKRYLLYKNNLIVVFDKLSSGEIMLFITSGNVSGQRSVSVADMQKKLDEKYKDYIPLEIANSTVAEKGYLEFLLISPEQYSLTPKPSNLYVIANEDGIAFKDENVWQQGRPMTVTLINEDLYIVANKLFIGGSSNLSVEINNYKLKDGKFVLNNSIDAPDTHMIIGTVENNEFKCYNVKYNEKWDIRNGKGETYLIDKEIEYSK